MRASDAEQPEGWTTALLGELVELKYGKGLIKESRAPGPVPVYGSNGVVGHHKSALTHGSTIVVGRKGSVGAVHLSLLPCWPIDTTYFVDEFGPFELRFLFHTLKALELAEHESSTAIPGLSRDDAYVQTVTVPPLAEQHRIVAQVEALLANVNAARERLAKVPAILKRFRQAALAAACSGRLTEEWRERNKLANEDPPWPPCRLQDVCSAVVDCPHSTPKWTKEGEICLRTTNFAVTGLDLSEVRYVSADTYRHRIARLEPARGDVVYSREGGILGIACVLPAGLRACLGQRMMAMRPDRRRMVPEFLCHVLNSPPMIEVVRELTGGTASPHLNVAEIKQFAVPLPPLAEQHEIVRRVDSLFTLADAIERRVAAATARAEKLTQAILAKALRGELVPTEAELARREGREYEPAALLLERIRAERAPSPRGRGRRRRCDT